MQSKWLSALLVIGCVTLISGIGFADSTACPAGFYSQYLGQGFSCTVNDKTFSDFGYQATSTPPGFEIPAGSVSVVPITTPGNPGFKFSAAWLASTATGIQSRDSFIQFQANAPQNAPFTDVSLSIGGYGFQGTGQIVVDETVCLGAMFPACTGGTVRSLEVFADRLGTVSFDEITFPGVTEIDVEKDVLIDAGTYGSASLSFITEQFSEGPTTPEPASILLFGSGALALAGVLRRKLKQ